MTKLLHKLGDSYRVTFGKCVSLITKVGIKLATVIVCNAVVKCKAAWQHTARMFSKYSNTLKFERNIATVEVAGAVVRVKQHTDSDWAMQQVQIVMQGNMIVDKVFA